MEINASKFGQKSHSNFTRPTGLVFHSDLIRNIMCRFLFLLLAIAAPLPFSNHSRFFSSTILCCALPYHTRAAKHQYIRVVHEGVHLLPGPYLYIYIMKGIVADVKPANWRFTVLRTSLLLLSQCFACNLETARSILLAYISRI